MKKIHQMIILSNANFVAVNYQQTGKSLDTDS